MPARKQSRCPASLDDDGIIDLTAVEYAARGTRRVTLTRDEQRVAAAFILARGGDFRELMATMNLSWHDSLRLRNRVMADEHI